VNYEISKDRKKCIPKEDLMIPFLFIGVFFFLSLIVFITKCIKRETRAVSTLIILFSYLEMPLLIYQVAFAIKNESYGVLVCMMIGILGIWIMNLCVFIYFMFFFNKDSVFKHWDK
jgi:cation transport ATPase